MNYFGHLFPPYKLPTLFYSSPQATSWGGGSKLATRTCKSIYYGYRGVFSFSSSCFRHHCPPTLGGFCLIHPPILPFSTLVPSLSPLTIFPLSTGIATHNKKKLGFCSFWKGWAVDDEFPGDLGCKERMEYVAPGSYSKGAMSGSSGGLLIMCCYFIGYLTEGDFELSKTVTENLSFYRGLAFHAHASSGGGPGCIHRSISTSIPPSLPTTQHS